MADKKTKTVGLELEVWRQLKQMSLDRDATLSETVDFLMKRMQEQGKENAKPSSDGTDKSAD